ncbi:hypothetical protein FB45DRAFT_894925 [Roridomyces roridus]|uniref:F-box domain-containing protein n=1 Tax=Roridomyces roridus TaxID=1738132 RepID=A0AAD7CGK8_9AGAR|nr:hypothetical protein FB45DRAFT_894925 [Roridomyces roridus]
MSLLNSFRFSFRFPVDPSHPQSSVLLDPDAQPEAILRVLRSTAENEQLRGFATIRTIAQVATSEIARYQEEIEKVDGQLERLRTDVDRGPGSAGHNELIATLDKRRLRMLDDHEKLCHLSAVAISIDAPVRRLPTEILGRIFQLCRDDKTAFRDGPHRQELRYLAGGALVPLSQVSSRWRDVVHGTPSFWSDIELDIHLWGDGPVSRDCLKHSYAHARRLLKVFLKRAGTMPLTLRIVGDDMCRGEMLRRIAKEAHRWRTASFSLDAEMLGEALPASSDAPLLQSLELEVLSEGGALLQNTLAGFHRIPASCKLRISAPAASLVHFPVPLERIETLTYRCVGWEELPLVLRQMGDLPVGAAVHMEIDFGDLLRNGVEDERMTLPDVVSHIGRLEVSSWTRLRFLGQCADTEISLAAIFRYVSLPNHIQALPGVLAHTGGERNVLLPWHPLAPAASLPVRLVRPGGGAHQNPPLHPCPHTPLALR